MRAYFAQDVNSNVHLGGNGWLSADFYRRQFQTTTHVHAKITRMVRVCELNQQWIKIFVYVLNIVEEEEEAARLDDDMEMSEWYANMGVCPLPRH